MATDHGAAGAATHRCEQAAGRHREDEGQARVTITFNDVLQKAGIDPKGVKLARHQKSGQPSGIYEAWRADPSTLESYQRLQAKPVFRGATHVASFVVTPGGDTLFTGLYTVGEVTTAPDGTLDPIFGNDNSGCLHYDLTPDPRLDEFAGRLRIDWGKGYVGWHHWAKNDKPVLEIRDEPAPPFPGFDALRVDVENFDRMPAGWVQVLRTIKGVYLLVDRETGKQYVGSAKGADSIWGRWAQYAHDGHGGNREMRKLGHRPYQMTVLQAMPMVTLDESVESSESLWKQKLLTRTFGLNAN